MVHLALANPISTFQAIVLGILQGATELFPVSSLGHTVVFPHLFGWDTLVRSQSKPESFWLAFVVMLHVGSAIGLLIYFWRDWIDIIRAFFVSLRRMISTRTWGVTETPTERLAWLIVVASIPTGILGVALEHTIRVALAKPLAASIFLIVNGGILLGAEQFRKRAEVRELALREGVKEDGFRRLDTLEYKEAAVIGTAQSAALVAGISRDGMCMTTGLARGLDNSDSARYAFLLATPIILAAGLYKLPDLMGHLGDHGVRGASVIAAVFAAVTGILTVHFLTRYFKHRNLIPFGIYCVLFGAAMVIFNIISPISG